MNYEEFCHVAYSYDDWVSLAPDEAKKEACARRRKILTLWALSHIREIWDRKGDNSSIVRESLQNYVECAEKSTVQDFISPDKELQLRFYEEQVPMSPDLGRHPRNTPAELAYWASMSFGATLACCTAFYMVAHEGVTFQSLADELSALDWP